MKNTLRLSLCILYLTFLYGCSSSESINCYLPEPQISSNSPLITGAVLQLNTPIYAEGASYLWSGPNNFQSTLQNPTVENVTPEMSGDYRVKVVKGICESTEVSTTVEITAPNFPCDPSNNTLTFTQTSTSINFNSVYSSTSTGEYQIRAGSLNADLTITFPNDAIPTPGVYQISNSCPTSFLTSNEVCVSLNYLSFSYANTGNVYITIENGKITARFCDIVFNQSGITLNSFTKITLP
ncbi:hypothetical protein [Flavobacterium sp.]|uniref:hypothetical protein n=1 Tax=Flavobacterium sp. TaxID=239 RepID=UPI002636428B|nr:hypothetical protein [Flavobacterium sp.]